MPRTPRVSRPMASADHSALTEDDQKLVNYLEGQVIYNNARGYLSTAEQAREWFLEDGKLDVCPKFCDVVQGQDYAWRVLRQPKFMTAVIDYANGFDGPKFDEAQTAKAQALLILLSDSQPVDVILESDEENQTDLVMELAEGLFHYLHSGVIPEVDDEGDED